MARAERSGGTVHAADVPLILAMVARGDRRHDIAAWLGLNQGRIAEVEEGRHGTAALADESALPPSGSPGPKALSLRTAVERAVASLEEAGPDVMTALRLLRAGASRFDKDE